MLIRRGGERILVDCGEGTQRQLMRSCGLAEIDCVLLTHGHADHVLGIPGMLKTFGLRERTSPLCIAGPRGTARLLSSLAPVIGRLPYDLDVVECGDGDVAWSGEDYTVYSFATDHSVPSCGYRLSERDRPGRFDVEAAEQLGIPSGPLFGALQRGEDAVLPDGTVIRAEQVVGDVRPGRRIVFTGDTRACSSVRDAAYEATLLVHEATFMSEDADRAADTGHSTAAEAALTAVAANAGLLALTHVSARYRAKSVLAEARELFEYTVLPHDFDAIEIPYPDRGAPELIHGGGRSSQGDAPVPHAGSPA